MLMWVEFIKRPESIMAIKDILVAYDGKDKADTALHYAGHMARKHGSSVTGLHVYQPWELERGYQRWIPDSVKKNIEEADLAVEDQIKACFLETAKAAGLGKDAKWISCKGSPSILMPRYSRYFDILIAGHFRSADAGVRGGLNPEELLLRSGKPVITVPENFEEGDRSGRAAVAWDGSRAAARALTDAMSILKAKKEVDVIRLIEADEDETKRVLPEHDLIAHLHAHGIKADLVNLKPGQAGVGQTILGHCDDTKADLLVMGAYGRGKFGTFIFGSTAQTVLRKTNVPVLMSH